MSRKCSYRSCEKGKRALRDEKRRGSRGQTGALSSCGEGIQTARRNRNFKTDPDLSFHLASLRFATISATPGMQTAGVQVVNP